MRPRDATELFLLAMLWGGSFLFMRQAVPTFGPVPLIELRCGIAGLFLLPVLWQRRELKALATHWRPLTMVGIFNSALPFILIAYGTLSLTAGFAAVLNATSPLFGAIVAYLWLNERLNWSRLIGLGVGFAGIIVLVSDKLSFVAGGSGYAVLAGLAATVCYGISANYAKIKLRGVSSPVVSAGSQLSSALMLAPLAFLAWPETVPPTSAWLAVTALAIFCTAIGYILYFRLIANVGPTKAIAVTFLVPAFGMLWGLLFLSEAITPRMILGCLVILLGVGLSTGIIRPRIRASVT